MKDLGLTFYLSDSAYMTALRLVAGAVCSACDIDVDTTEDFKVCVTESVILLKDCGYNRAQITFCTEGGVSCTVSGEGGNPVQKENEFSLSLISALVGECAIDRAGGTIRRITLKL